MMRRIAGSLGAGFLRRRARWYRQMRDEHGYVTILVAIVVPVVLVGCCAVGVDTANWYVAKQQMQKMADDAALGGVPFLPQDFPSAKARALEILARNGFDASAPGNSVTITVGTSASQLKVSVTSKVSNTFGSVIGVPAATITESATADYQGPAPMGSPCNAFGNEPKPGSQSSSAKPTGSVLPTGSAACSSTPQFWAGIEGPETDKVQGDEYQAAKCANAGSTDGCSGTSNSEYDDFGYVFIVKVQPNAVNLPITLQLYDPEMAWTGSNCKSNGSYFAGPTKANITGTASSNWNNFMTVAEAQDHYATDDTNLPEYCTGDSFPGMGAPVATAPNPTITSFVLRQQIDSQNPKFSSVQKDTSGNACIKQYGAYNLTNKTSAATWASDLKNNTNQLATVFHNWSDLCTFTPTRSGDYYLQVRTNVSMGGSVNGLIGTGNMAAAALTGNSTTGMGSNMFSVRAVPSSPALAGSISVSGYNTMPIFMNAVGSSGLFNLIRVLPGAAGSKIQFSFFDAGDASGAGTIQVLTPSDGTGTIVSTPFPGGCSASGGAAGSLTSLTNCTAPISSATNNGRLETVTIPIPSDYSCDYMNLTGCWYKVRVTFGGATSVTDFTTWTANVNGDPVRLVR